MRKLDPKVSVIMGIYNCEKTLEESIKSIINQTYPNWELIMCDDGSTDDTYQIAKKYSEKYSNIILIQNESNKGLNYTLNHCLNYATGKYIARQDGDDLSLPDRFEKQVNILESTNYGVVSSAMIYFDEQGEWGQGNPVQVPTKLDFINESPICHAPCMVRKEIFDEVSGYSDSKYLLRVEDYHLWFKIYAKGYKAFNIKEPLYKMFDGRDAFNRRKFKYRINEMYVKFIGFRMLDMPIKYYPYILRPIIVGLLPKSIYMKLHKLRLNKSKVTV